jgi:hypothetical protein
MGAYNVQAKAVRADCGEIYYILDNRRLKLADCSVEARIYERHVEVPTIGSRSIKYKSRHVSIVLCDKLRGQKVELTDALISKIRAFEIIADFQLANGDFERIVLPDLNEAEIDLDGEWKFNLEDEKVIQKLLQLE